MNKISKELKESYNLCRIRQKQYNKLSKSEKYEFERFVFHSAFINFSGYFLFEDNEVSNKEKRIMLSFLWDCYFGALSPLDQAFYCINVFKKAEKGKEAYYISEASFELWDKLQTNKKRLQKNNDKWLEMREEFSLLFKDSRMSWVQDIYNWCGENKLFYKISKKIKKIF